MKAQVYMSIWCVSVPLMGYFKLRNRPRCKRHPEWRRVVKLKTSKCTDFTIYRTKQKAQGRKLLIVASSPCLFIKLKVYLVGFINVGAEVADIINVPRELNVHVGPLIGH